MSDTDRLWKRIRNEQRADRRRELYANDPIWRLTKLKDNWERRERARQAVAGTPSLSDSRMQDVRA